MASVDAAMRHYRQEFIASFEDRQSVLRSTCTQEAVISGNEAIFLVAGSGSATAQTRGVDGLLSARADTETQNTALLQEWHDLVRKTNFNIFASQGDQRRIMQMTTMAVLNRKMDDLIITALGGATNQVSTTAAVASLDGVVDARTILGNAFVDLTDEDNLFALVSPAFEGYMMQVPEYASADYVEVKPLTGPARRFRRWMGFNWIVHPRLEGSVGAGGAGSSESCFFFHRDAMGCAVDTAGIDAPIGYDEEQAYSWCRVSVHMGAVLMQQAGIVEFLHDGSAYVAV